LRPFAINYCKNLHFEFLRILQTQSVEDIFDTRKASSIILPKRKHYIS